MTDETLDEALSGEQQAEAEQAAPDQETGVSEDSPPESEIKEPEVNLAELKAELESLRKESSGLKYALTDERQKRQLLEGRMSQTQQEPSLPDPLDDPKGYQAAIAGQVQSMMLQERINMSRSMAQIAHPDYAEKEQFFADMARQNPQLVDAMRNNPNPAEFAYQVAAARINQQSPDQKLEAELAKMRKEYEERLAEITGKLAPQPVPDASSGNPGAAVGDESLFDIFKR